TLAWLANQACIEIHPWLSRVTSPRRPDLMVLDIDPMPPTGFNESLIVAREIKKVLDAVGLRSWIKTSGATGLHIYVPIEPKYDYPTVVKGSLIVARTVKASLPELVTLERTVAKRGPKVYLDCYQNALGKTLAAPYSVRPRRKAPVSIPLSWDEIEPSGIRPEDFNIKSVPQRLKEVGDPFRSLLDYAQPLEVIMR
ncbi:MAG TPA: DNA polymerase domain-containing protein, partial [Clostridia bacterium]|nr:DNA polymerase domain-containing protein [Clostridia bacterium]